MATGRTQIFIIYIIIFYERAGNTRNNLLGLLPSEFTRQMAQDMRIAQGRNPNPRNMLAQWTHRGYIVKDEARDVYIKV